MNLQISTALESKQGKYRKAIRRPMLHCADSGMLLEAETVYVYRTHPKAPLNTQKALLSDLKSFLQWQQLRRLANPRWVPPHERILKRRAPLTSKEIADLARWLSEDAATLSRAVEYAVDKVDEPVSGPGVEAATTNRKLRTIASYLAFLIKDAGAGSDITRAVFAKRITDEFLSHLLVDKKMPEVRSLSEGATQDFQKYMRDPKSFAANPVGRRNRLIAAICYEAGLRPGELLKLRCSDLQTDVQYRPGKFATCLFVVHRRNDAFDSRLHEPAAKTRPGVLPISQSLARAIQDYILGDRAKALSRTGSAPTPYLLVNHHGVEQGKPMSQRRLNQIFQDLRSNSVLIPTLNPYVLRHTHLNEIYEQAEATSKNARDVLIERGRWSEKSTMPSRYASRAIKKLTAKLVDERESIIENHGTSTKR